MVDILLAQVGGAERCARNNRTQIRAEVRSYLAYSTDRTAQLPDPIRHRDIAWFGSHVPADSSTEVVLARALRAPPAVHQRAPKPLGGWRDLAVVSPYADLRLRALIDLDARRWESRQAHPLFNGKCRAVSIPGNERTLELENPSKSHRRLRNAIADASSQDHYRAGFKTDITQFYPSLLPAVVDDCMQRSGFPSTHAAEIRHWLDWIGSEGFTGVPIGPELSIVLANLALARADRALRAIGVSVLRWTDDYVVLGESVDQADDAFAKLKQELLSIGLRLHPAKTEFFRTPEEVAEFLASRRAVSLEPLGLTRGDPLRRRVRDQDGKLAESPALTEMRVERAEELFLSEFDREVGVGERERWLRYHLKVFLGLDIVSQHIADELLCHPDRWVHACPVVSAYLRASMTDAQALRALYLASDRASDDFEEQAIHLLHACRGRQYGAAEAEWLLTIARTVDSELLAGTARGLASDFSDVPSAEAIEHGELDTLRPYEQRWAIGGLHLTQRRKRYLQSVRPTSLWPGTVDWKLAETA